MNSIFTYIFLGISLAAPIGPVNAAQLDTGIKNGFFHALIFGFGALIADILYMVMVYFGVGQFIDSPYMKIFLWSFGCFVLTYTGIESLLTLRKIKVDMKSGKRIRLRQSLLSGFLVSLLTPLTILFWLGIYGSVLAETSQTFQANQIITFSFAIIVGILLWNTTMAFLSSGARKFLSTRFLIIISLVSSLSMIVFGIYFGIQAYHTLF
ncbi:threonine/homoserine/homoserine lactone efflux protein [Psychrobacillus insolitus]|uniref:Threonine/homoserine/homoserine lactone efflux protein n=1 Tax=Psychrobacillus insolitus TaxID=1461 RepID=A0A2W7N2T1_9BACI|nr:LysE family transporter [Psychrobacillus insolitus]PZX02864.1 threonine/homoserine/homoserine lactone efflux protein [Psychrobacillus insolitus]